MIVWVNRLSLSGRIEKAGGTVSDHLIGVHVGACAGARLEDVDDKLPVPLSACHLLGGLGDRAGHLLLEQSEREVGLSGGVFEYAERLNETPV